MEHTILINGVWTAVHDDSKEDAGTAAKLISEIPVVDLSGKENKGVAAQLISEIPAVDLSGKEDKGVAAQLIAEIPIIDLSGKANQSTNQVPSPASYSGFVPADVNVAEYAGKAYEDSDGNIIANTYQKKPTMPVVPNATGIRLISEAPNYSVTIDSPENIQISANVDGASVTFTSLAASKSITFLIESDSNSITFNETLIPAGETVFAIYAGGEWTINSTVVNIPVIPNYSDISVHHKVDTSVDLEALAGGNFRTYDATVITFAKDDKILLANQFLGSEKGVYQIQVVFNYAILNLIAYAPVLDIVRVEGYGAYQSTYDGMFPDAITFVKIGSGAGSGLPTIPANSLTDFTGQEPDGVYTIVGLKGILISVFNTPFVEQTVICDNTIYTRSFDATVQTPIVPPFTDMYATKLADKADLVEGVIPANQLPTNVVNSYQLESITTVPDNFVSGQRYYNATDNKIYLFVGGSTGVIDWSTTAKGQILKFGANYYTFSDKLNLLGSNKLKIGLSKNGANGTVNPQIIPAENYDRTITEINLASNCGDVNIAIGADTYDHTTLLNTVLPAGTEMIINDITVKAGGTNANAIIILQ